MSDPPAKAPRAFIAHRTARRLRIRIPERRGDRDYFARLKETFAAIPGVGRIDARPATGSLIVEHDGVEERLLEYARRYRLFEAGPPTTLAQYARASAHQADHLIENFSGGRLDADSVVMLALAGAAVAQIARGQIGVPAGALLYYLYTQIEQRDDDRPPS